MLPTELPARARLSGVALAAMVRPRDKTGSAILERTQWLRLRLERRSEARRAPHVSNTPPKSEPLLDDWEAPCTHHPTFGKAR